MILISHRGNLTGPNPKKENHPDYILNALREGYEVEIDVWFENDKYKEYGLNGRLTFEDGTTRAEAQLLQSRKIEEIQYQLAYDRAKKTRTTLTLTTAFSALF